MKTNDQTKAAKLSGYSEKSSIKYGAKLLQDAEVQAMLAKELGKEPPKSSEDYTWSVRDKNYVYKKTSSKPTNNKTREIKKMSGTITDYKILSNENYLSLASSVKIDIKDGWQPQGGIGVVDYQGKGLIGGTGRYEFFQAMVKIKS